MDVTNRKIIFLDVDGVLATPKSIHAYAQEHGGHCPPGAAQLDPECCAVLNKIVEKLNALVVISSTWRKNDNDLADLIRFLSYFTIPIIGTTPLMSISDGRTTLGRQFEIMTWCHDRCVHPDNMLVIDDDSEDLTAYHDRLLQTDGSVGLQKEDIDLAVKIANRKSGYHMPDALKAKWWQFWR